MSNARVAIVSATGTGTKRILPALRRSTRVTVTAVHGRDEAKLRQVAEEFAVPGVFTDLEEMIAVTEFDLAVVCSPPFMHLQQLEALVRAGIPTLCEKPLALTEQEAQMIKDMTDRSQTLVMVAHQLRHHAAYAEIEATIARGDIGEVRSAFFEWSFTMDRAAPNARWKQDPILNGPSSLTDAGIHCVDVAIGLFGPGVVTGVSSAGPDGTGTHDACDLLALHGDVQVAIRASRLHGPYSNQLLISGDRGEITAPLFFTETSASEVRMAGTFGVRAIRLQPADPYRQEVEDFASAALVPGFRSRGTSLEQAVYTCRMIDQAHEMLRSTE